jgi:hypothetical protein
MGFFEKRACLGSVKHPRLDFRVDVNLEMSRNPRYPSTADDRPMIRSV